MIEQVRKSELTPESQLFLGGSADEKVKASIIKRQDVRAAFFRALKVNDSASNSASVADTIIIMSSMLDYMWNADTPRRLRSLRLKFGVFKSVNVQHATRAKVAPQKSKRKEPS